MTNNKSLGEWTLAEIAKYCNGRACADCLFSKNAGVFCVLEDNHPMDWVLSEPPRWTEQEVEDAKALLRLLPDFITIERLTTKHFDTEILVIEDTGHPNPNRLRLPPTLFPSLKMNKEVKLREIAEYKREE